jgi:lipopolysaccharide export system permease protein
VKIISRYILREHVGPFVFALTALTSLMLLNFISRQFGELVGKGLDASVIGEFFLLSIPFTVALTLPMSVLVAVLYAFSRLASENEVTALKASGVSPWRLVTPAIAWGLVMSLFLLAFNDQVLPRANHRLKTLQDDIAQTKPTFLLKAQVINAISEGKLYLKAGQIDQNTGKMKEIVIYDMGDPMRRRTIYAASGSIQFTPNRKDLDLDLYNAQMLSVSTDKPNQLDRMFYDHNIVRVKDVGGSIKRSEVDSTSRGDRELGVCQMQKRLRVALGRYNDAKRDYEEAVRHSKVSQANKVMPDPVSTRLSTVPPEPHGIGWAYCTLVTRIFGVRAAEAAELRTASLHPMIVAPQGLAGAQAQDTTKRPVQDTTRKTAPDTTKKVAQDTAKKPATDTAKRAVAPAAATPPAAQAQRQPPVVAPPVVPGAPPTTEPRVLINGVMVDPRTGLPAPAAAPPQPGVILGTSTPGVAVNDATLRSELPDSLKNATQRAAEAVGKIREQEASRALFISKTAETKLQLDLATKTRNRFEIEINKKFSLAAACLIFVVLGAPIALRFPRGGVGLVIGVSLVVFALYYVGLIGGEALANKALIPPFWAMWGTNVILTIVGIVLLFRMGHEENSGRGGDWGDRIDKIRNALRFRRRRAASLAEETA